MPTVEVHVLEGYSADAKRRLAQNVTDAVRSVVPASPDLVTVMIRQMQAEDYYRGRRTRTPAPARPDPEKIVRAFLEAMQNRDLEAAGGMLASTFTMQFPGAPPMTQLSALIDWAAPRYLSVAKTYDGFETLQSQGEAAIVYCRGTLSGIWPDNTPFEGIRFIDRFEVEGDKITQQDVWNDIAETKAQG